MKLLNLLVENALSPSEISDMFDQISRHAWKDRGVKFGKIQTMDEIDISGSDIRPPSKFDNSTKFISASANVAVGRI